MLFFVCIHSVDFIPTLGGAILPALIIDPRSLFSVYGGNISRDPTRVLATDLCVMCFLYVMISLCMFSYFHSVLGRAILPVAMDLPLSFFPVYGGWYVRSLLCIAFTFMYVSVGFIWKNGSNVVSSLLVRAILPFFTNFAIQSCAHKSSLSFLFDVILLVIVMILM